MKMDLKNQPPLDPIAIVGMSCRFPGNASNPQKFWKILCEGKDAIVDIPEKRWDSRRFYHPDVNVPGKMYVKKGGFLTENWEDFDAEFFHISPREAHFLDPQQRLLLELTWEAMEDGGIVPEKLRCSDAGVFIGAFTTDWQTLQNSPYNRQHCSMYSGINGSKTILSARLSYFFDLKGPCLTLDTACSSSLVAVHLACQNLQQRVCSLAIAGGVNAMLVPETTIAMSKGRFLNPDGLCRSFDREAKGYIRGEGGGIVLLKRLSDALRDKDPIYALIRGTGINHDGYTQGIAKPNPDAQKDLIQKVLMESRVEPWQIHYVEAHGTGTPVGDPIEAMALDQVLHVPEQRSHPCYLGAVKSNIGHLEAAAGIAGIIKTALCLRHQQIPPNLHYSGVNPHIPFEKYCLKIPMQVENFPAQESPLFACVNSFGYGGTNAHAVLQSFEQERTPQSNQEITPTRPFLLPFTAKNRDGLKGAITQSLNHLQENPQYKLADLAYTLSQKRSLFEHRLAISAQSEEELKYKLQQINKNELPEGCKQGKVLDTEQGLVFVYSGMGPQWWGMGRQLMECSSHFLETLKKCDRALLPISGWSLLEELQKDENSSRMENPEVAQLANYSIQISLTELLKTWGIKPSAIVGHSVGEVAAAYAAGSLSLEEGLFVTYHRSRIQAQRKNLGTMLAVGLGRDEVQPILNKYPGVSLAAENSPHSLTLAGNPDELKLIAENLESNNIFNRFLKVNIAYHSHQMDGLENVVMTTFNSLFSKKPSTPLFSTVYANEYQEKLDASYWWKNIRQPVLFAQTIQNIIQKGYRLFVEIGPHPVLSNFIKENLNQFQVNGESIPSLNRKKAEMISLQECIASLFVNGYPLSWNLVQPQKGNFISFPTYPWQKKAYWIESEESQHYRLSAKKHVMLSRKIKTPHPTWQVEINPHYFPWLEDHKIEGTIVFPGAAYVEAALAIHGTDQPTSLDDISFKKLLTIQSEPESILQISLENGTQFKAHSSMDAVTWECNAIGKCSPYLGHHTTSKLEFKELKQADFIDEEIIYEQFSKKGLEYGPAFRGIKKLVKEKNRALSEIHAPNDHENYHLHPALLDSALQTLIGAVDIQTFEDGLILPSRIQQMIFYKKPPKIVYCLAECTKQTKSKLIGDLFLCDTNSEICVQIKGLECQLITHSSKEKLERLTYKPVWEESPLNDQKNLDDQLTWLIGFSKDSNNQRFSQCLTDKNLCLFFDKLASTEDIEQLLMKTKNVENLQIVWGYECNATDKEFVQSEIQILYQFTKFINALALKREQQSTTLWIVTQATQSVGEKNHSINLSGLALRGIARVIRQEYPFLRMRMMDLDEGPLQCDKILLEATHNYPEDEIAWRQEKRYAYKLKRNELDPFEKKVSLSSPKQAFSLELKIPGKIDSLYYKEIEKKPPCKGEVGIQVHASSLNFKDLMKVLGLLNQNVLEDTFFGESFGMECSGTIVSLGSGVKDYKIGDKVCAFIPQTFQSYVKTSKQYICPIAPHVDLDQAPIYIPFITVLRALKDIAQLKKNECILIHSATGAVGLAAIQYAQFVGAKIFATAGSAEKREYLAALGVTHCSDSRSLSFVDDVLKWTQGKGVDVVLNSLGAEALTKSWSLLAPYGRFIEIGKRDISMNNPLPMQHFNNNTSFSAIDLDRTFIDQPQIIKRLLKEARKFFEKEIFKPLPCKIFPAQQATDAFHFMAHAKHIGKIMLNFDEQSVQGLSLDAQKPLINAHSSYLITGGLSGFGLDIAKWLVEKGAKYLILIGRRGIASLQTQEILETFKEQGVNIKAASVDVTNKEQLTSLIANCETTMPPLKGIIHAAMVLNDQPIHQISLETIHEVLLPKIAGCLNLHELTLHQPLEFFVLLSSISSIIGNLGQGNYAAANAFLDGFCQYRQAMGLPALTVNWGALNAGVLVRHQNIAKNLENHGIKALPVKTALHLLENAMRGKELQVCIQDVDWQQLMECMPSLKKSSVFVDFAIESNLVKKSNALAQELLEIDEDKRLDIVTDIIKETLAKTLKMDSTKIDIHIRLNTLGVDSLTAMELQSDMETNLGVKIPTLELMKGPTIKQLAKIALDILNKITIDLNSSKECNK